MYRFLLLIPFLLGGCQIGPRDIQYGEDSCHYCKMTVVDQQHAAQLVSDKGKVFVFDAIECMIHYLREERKEEVAFAYLLVNDYDDPGQLVPAADSYYLISEAIPSPMGAFLTAFAHENRAKQAQAAKGGTVYDWQAIQNQLP